MPAIANHINKNITVELLPVFCGYFGYFNYSFGIIAIYMKNRCLYDGSKGSTIIGTPCIIKISGETDLVIDHKVYGSPGIISFQFAHLQNFIYNSLACEGGISM